MNIHIHLANITCANFLNSIIYSSGFNSNICKEVLNRVIPFCLTLFQVAKSTPNTKKSRARSSATAKFT